MKKVLLVLLIFLGIVSVAKTSSASEETVYLCRESIVEDTFENVDCVSPNQSYTLIPNYRENGDDMVRYDECRNSGGRVFSDVSNDRIICAFFEKVEIGAPAVLCRQDHGMWRVYGHLVIAMEFCTSFNEDISPPDTMVLFLENYGNPRNRCDHMGGRYEYLGNPTGFNLNICWDVDY